MTTQNAKLNQAQGHNDQLRVLAVKMALESRNEGEDHSLTMKRIQDIYDFMKVSAPSLHIVGANELPNGVA